MLIDDADADKYSFYRALRRATCKASGNGSFRDQAMDVRLNESRDKKVCLIAYV